MKEWTKSDFRILEQITLETIQGRVIEGEIITIYPETGITIKAREGRTHFISYPFIENVKGKIKGIR